VAGGASAAGPGGSWGGQRCQHHGPAGLVGEAIHAQVGPLDGGAPGHGALLLCPMVRRKLDEGPVTEAAPEWMICMHCSYGQ
jgi:hypothetical protein